MSSPRVRQLIRLERAIDLLLPSWLAAIALSIRWRCRVSPFARLSFPWRIRLARGVTIDRCRIIASGSVDIGEGTYVHAGAVLDALAGEIRIGRRCGINPYCVLYGGGGLVVGDDCGIAAQTVIIPANHNTGDLDVPIMGQGVTMSGVRIEDDVWIGAGCRILDGVTIGQGAVIAAGAVVNRPVPALHVVAGIPARTVRVRERDVPARVSEAGAW